RHRRHAARADVPGGAVRATVRRTGRGAPRLGGSPAAEGSGLGPVGLTQTETFDALRVVLADALGVGSLELVAGHPMSAGASRLTSTLDVRADGVEHRLVLQRSRAAGKSHGDMAAEARLLRAAADAGVPVPKVIAAGAGLADLPGAYLVTSYVDGETI